jgi:hypothetical protein
MKQNGKKAQKKEGKKEINNFKKNRKERENKRKAPLFRFSVV